MYAIIAFVLFSGVPLVRHLIRKHNKSREANNAQK